MKIAAQLLKDLIFEEYEGNEWVLVEDEISGDWRWGIEKRVILKYETPGQPMSFWGFDYRVSTSNEEYLLQFIEDGDSEVELWGAVPVPVSLIQYQRRK